MDCRLILFIFLYCCLLFGANAFSNNERFELLEGVVADILERLEEKEARIRRLENLVNSQGEHIVLLEQKIQDQELIIHAIRNSNNHPNETSEEDIISQKENANEEMRIKAKGNQNQPSEHSEPSRIRRAENENPVAFLAALTDHAEHMGVLQNIAFDDVITNAGAAYNSHAGVFIAPVPGIYVFSTTLMSFASSAGHFRFLKNGATVANLYHQTTNYETTSMTLVLELEQGDDVSVANVKPDQNVHGGFFNTFSGFLLQQYYPVAPGVVGK